MKFFVLIPFIVLLTLGGRLEARFPEYEELATKCIQNSNKLKINNLQKIQAERETSIFRSISLGSGFGGGHTLGGMMAGSSSYMSSSIGFSIPLTELLTLNSSKSRARNIYISRGAEIKSQIISELLNYYLEYKELDISRQKTALDLANKENERDVLKQGLKVEKVEPKEIRDIEHEIDKLKLSLKEADLKVKFKEKEIFNYCGIPEEKQIKEMPEIMDAPQIQDREIRNNIQWAGK